MLTGINPFKTGQDLSLVEKMNEILNKEIPIPKRLSAEAKDMLKQILIKNVSAIYLSNPAPKTNYWNVNLCSLTRELVAAQVA